MKKFLTIAAFMLFAFTSAQAEKVRMGVTLQAGYFEATGASEIFSGAHSSGASPGPVTKSTATDGDDAEGEFGYGSIFAEVMATDNIGIGVSYVPMALESETTENVQTTTIAAKSTVTNTVQIDFEDLLELILEMRPKDGELKSEAVLPLCEYCGKANIPFDLRCAVCSQTLAQDKADLSEYADVTVNPAIDLTEDSDMSGQYGPRT